MTPQMLIDLMAGLGRSVPAEILPARVLVRRQKMIVWLESSLRTNDVFHRPRQRSCLEEHDGKPYPHPALCSKRRDSLVGSRSC